MTEDRKTKRTLRGIIECVRVVRLAVDVMSSSVSCSTFWAVLLDKMAPIEHTGLEADRKVLARHNFAKTASIIDAVAMCSNEHLSWRVV